MGLYEENQQRWVRFRLGEKHEFGIGVPKDMEAAVKWYRSAAERGSPPGQCALGRFYLLGKLVPQDSVEATRW